MTGLAIGAAIAVMLVFPVFGDLHLFWGKEHKKLFFDLRLYRVVKIYGGYGQIVRDGFAFHVSDGKAFLFPFESVLSVRKQFQITKGFFLSKLRIMTEIGYGDELAPPLMGAALLSAASGWTYAFLHEKYGNDVDFKSNTVFGEGDRLHFFLHLRFVFNLLILLIAGAKILLKKGLENGKAKQAG